MRYFGKAQPPTALDNVESNPGPKTGLEKVEDVEVGHASHHIEPGIEKNVICKMDRNITVLVSVLYLLAFLDRGNIGNARIAGMEDDLELEEDGHTYEWLLNIFYIAYILFEWMNMMWKVLPPHIWATVMVLGWGVVSSAQAGTTTWSGMMACRFFLGFCEAGFGPGIPFLLSFFYLRHELGLRIGLFLSAAPLANTFAGALAYGITSGHANIANWRLLFLVEGLPTVVMAAVAFFALPDSPHTAWFLSEKEKKVALARGVRQVGDVNKRIGMPVWKDVAAALMDPKCWFTAFMYFSCNVSFSSLPVFLPTILKDMGFSDINAQGLTAPPYFVSFIVTIGSTYVADKIQQRGLTIAFLSCIGGIGYILLVSVESVGVRYFGVFLAASGVFPSIANILPWTLNNQGSDTRRGIGIVILNTIGQCGPLLGSNIFPKTDSPRYIKGFAICAGFIFFNALLALTLRTLLVWENKQLDKKYGSRTTPSTHEKVEGDTNVGEENYSPTYRYVL